MGAAAAVAGLGHASDVFDRVLGEVEAQQPTGRAELAASESRSEWAACVLAGAGVGMKAPVSVRRRVWTASWRRSASRQAVAHRTALTASRQGQVVVVAQS
ncbi:hypothetical protein ABZ016_13135 [Streptomyces sp. NPDC006372]|uniref:hypothetical protein n=1 Tax=Streptomyces sp. NPDC006372 TaxID=3155599 RepID=UPI0033B14287